MAKGRTSNLRVADTRVAVSPLELLESVLDRIDCETSFVLRYYIACGDYRRAAEYRVDPRDFNDPDGYALASACIALVSKFPDFPGVNTRDQDALRKFMECEEVCRLTNERFANRDQLYQDFPEALRPVLWRARSKIRRLLGAFSWDKVVDHMTWGPGSSTSLPRRRAHGAYKFGHKPDCTIDNLAPAVTLIGLDRNWSESASGTAAINSPYDLVNLVIGSKITTVPKDSFIDRVIAIEPDMNMFVQKGFGTYIRRCLKKRDIDLDTQERNQIYAKLGSTTGEFATLDLSSASDTISYEVVKFLLPYDWFEAMLHARSQFGILPDGRVIPFHKFSSMGNGYTFELESLIFWALADCVVELSDGYRDVAVFGDDIIVPTPCYGPLSAVLELFGFSVNRKKSFADGPFRESCGKHYFNGNDVTPPRWTKPVRVMSDLFRLVNRFIRFSIRLGNGNYRDSRLRDVVVFLIRLIEPRLRSFRIPDGVGDGGIVSSFDEALPFIHRSKRGLEGYFCRVLNSQQDKKQLNGVGVLLWSLHTLHRSREVTAMAPSLALIQGQFKAKQQLVTKWSYVGPWA